jgi:hypothetical protein
MADYVARSGDKLIEVVLERQKGNPKYDFLMDGKQHNEYFWQQVRVKRIEMGSEKTSGGLAGNSNGEDHRSTGSSHNLRHGKVWSGFKFDVELLVKMVQVILCKRWVNLHGALGRLYDLPPLKSPQVLFCIPCFCVES